MSISSTRRRLEMHRPRAADPTNSNLAFALLDQRVAGTFHGKRFAYIPVVGDKSPWAIGIAVENERGFNPVEGEAVQFQTRDDVETFVDGMNGHIGLSRADEFAIIASTMRR